MKKRTNSVYSVSLDGIPYPSIQMVAKVLGMKQITLMQRVRRAGGEYETAINGRVLIVKKLNIIL